MAKFEYKIAPLDEAELNQLGEEGWEAAGLDPNGQVLLKKTIGRVPGDIIGVRPKDTRTAEQRQAERGPHRS